MTKTPERNANRKVTAEMLADFKQRVDPTDQTLSLSNKKPVIEKMQIKAMGDN